MSVWWVLLIELFMIVGIAVGYGYEISRIEKRLSDVEKELAELKGEFKAITKRG